MSSALDFGDYCYIEQKRYGVPNEMYQHKVIGRLRSNAWVDVPVQSPATETLHSELVDVIACICCGVSEREVRKYRAVDCKSQPDLPPHLDSRYPNSVSDEYEDPEDNCAECLAHPTGVCNEHASDGIPS